MRVGVTFRHMEATDALREYAEEKVQHTERLIRNAIDAHVVLSVTKHRHLAEITVHADHDTFNATEETGDLYSAIDQAIAKIERQMRKHTTKRESRKHTHVEGGENERQEPPRRRVEPEVVAVEPMSVGEALKLMDQQRRDALIFREPGTNLVNFLYRKKDGSMGLFEAEGI